MRYVALACTVEQVAHHVTSTEVPLACVVVVQMPRATGWDPPAAPGAVRLTTVDNDLPRGTKASVCSPVTPCNRATLLVHVAGHVGLPGSWTRSDQPRASACERSRGRSASGACQPANVGAMTTPHASSRACAFVAGHGDGGSAAGDHDVGAGHADSSQLTSWPTVSTRQPQSMQMGGLTS